MTTRIHCIYVRLLLFILHYLFEYLKGFCKQNIKNNIKRQRHKEGMKIQNQQIQEEEKSVLVQDTSILPMPAEPTPSRELFYVYI